MNYFVDTNVLARFVDRRHPHSNLARTALKKLAEDKQTLCVTPQNAIELWNVVTRPLDKNGLGRTTAEAFRILRMVERFFVMLPDTPQIYQVWRRLVIEHQVHGVQVHDARLVAVMRAHDISHILTFNGKDFARYSRDGIVAVHPNDDAIVRRVRENMEGYQVETERPADVLSTLTMDRSSLPQAFREWLGATGEAKGVLFFREENGKIVLERLDNVDVAMLARIRANIAKYHSALQRLADS